MQPHLAAEGGSPLVKYALLEAACAAAAGERPRGGEGGMDGAPEPPAGVAAGLADMAAEYLIQSAADRDAPAGSALALAARCPVRERACCLSALCVAVDSQRLAALTHCTSLGSLTRFAAQGFGASVLASLRGTVQAAAGRDADRLRWGLAALLAVLSDPGVKVL